MKEKHTPDRRRKILKGVYSSTWETSVIALAMVAVLEIAMLIYSTINWALFGEYIWKYRIFYILLLSIALVYLGLYVFVKKDMDRRYVLLNVANPFCALFFFAWSLAITLSDALKYNVIDPAVFMTFSLTVPLSFFLFPAVYAAIVLAADIVMLYATATISGALGPMINLTIFFLFQLVLGVSYLRLKMRLAERIVQEEENAGIDVLTGFPNRRQYEDELKKLLTEPVPEDLVYIAIDMNGLKEVNDTYGHDVGDSLIVGAAQCIEQCFGKLGKRYRIGGACHDPQRGPRFRRTCRVPGQERHRARPDRRPEDVRGEVPLLSEEREGSPAFSGGSGGDRGQEPGYRPGLNCGPARKSTLREKSRGVLFVSWFIPTPPWRGACS